MYEQCMPYYETCERSFMCISLSAFCLSRVARRHEVQFCPRDLHRGLRLALPGLVSGEPDHIEDSHQQIQKDQVASEPSSHPFGHR
jgi:hypothetical protein